MFDVLLKLQLMLSMTALEASNLYNGTNSSNEEVASPLLRDGRFFSGQINGTYWCGSGNGSQESVEIGPNFDVDSCCLNHYNCYSYIEPGEKHFGLRNEGKYTQVAYHCDDDFFKCLNSSSAWSVINTYGLTYPKCIVHRFEYIYRCLKPDLIDPTGVCGTFFDLVAEAVDSKFKLHQMETDREEASKKNKEQNRLAPSTIYRSPLPTVQRIFNRTP